jgi:hypothetical protein
MGLWNWLKSFVRQVAEDDLEGTGASEEASVADGKPAAPSASPLYTESDTGGAPSSATAPDPQGRDGGTGLAVRQHGDGAASEDDDDAREFSHPNGRAQTPKQAQPCPARPGWP